MFLGDSEKGSQFRGDASLDGRVAVFLGLSYIGRCVCVSSISRDWNEARTSTGSHASKEAS